MATTGIKTPPVYDNCCHSQLKTIPFSCMWKIDNFSRRETKAKAFVKSSTFIAGEKERIAWHIKLCPVGRTEEGKDYLSIYLNVSSDDGEIQAIYALSILNEKMEATNICVFDTKFNEQTPRWGRKKFIDRDIVMSKSNGLLPNDVFTVHCVGNFFTKTNDNIVSTGNSNPVLLEVPECTAFHNYARLLESEKFSDATITACNAEFKVHKAILAAQSTVFAGMFNCKNEGGMDINRIDIRDVQPEVVREMLRFIYTGEARNLEKIAASLLTAADAYDLGRLKAMCAASLLKNLKTDNAADTLMLANRHSVKLLKEQTIGFINKHAEEVIGYPNYELMVTAYPRLIDEIFQASISTQNVEAQKGLQLMQKRIN